MSGLVKATLQELRSDENSTPAGDPVPVQFNPSSLRLQLSNSVEGGKSRGRQERQHLGTASTELSFDLVFDTADEELSRGRPRSVREKTAVVERFILPRGDGDQQAPPKVRFQWGGLVIDGIISSVNIDFDHFASDGTPLRAKMGVSIKEQNARYEIQERASGSGRPRSARALGGESAAEFAARVGLDAGAWKGLAAGIEGTLSLQAGLEIGFDASLNVGVGLGVTAGFQAGLGVSLEASLGLQAGASATARIGGGAAAGAGGGGSVRGGAAVGAGQALARAGGVAAAIETVKSSKARAAVSQARAAFSAPAPAPVSALPAPADSGTAAPGAAPVAVRGAAVVAATASARGAAAAPVQGGGAPRPPRADPRATSFGQGVPLRPRVEGAAEARAGAIALRPYERADRVPTGRVPGVPGWKQLPEPKSTRPPAGKPRGKAGCSCGCGGKRGH